MAERLERLERRCMGLEGRLRRWRRCGLLALALAALVVAGGAIRDRVRETVVERLTLVDKANKERAVLEVDRSGFASFTLHDAEGRKRLSLLVEREGGSYVDLIDDEGSTHCN